MKQIRLWYSMEHFSSHTHRRI